LLPLTEVVRGRLSALVTILYSSLMTGKFSYSKAFGKASLEDNAKDMSTETVFQIASMTKLMTSISALQVVERGLIGLDDDVSSVIPELVNEGVLTGFDGETPKTEKIQKKMTLRHARHQAQRQGDPDSLLDIYSPTRPD